MVFIGPEFMKQTNYTSLKGKKVLVFGLGLSDGGAGIVDFLVDQGAQITVPDMKTRKELAPSLKRFDRYGDQVEYHLGGHMEEDFLTHDVIIRNPAVKPGNKWLKVAMDAEKTVEMEMSLFHQLAPCPIVGVTGTKGKSTTATLLYLFLQKFRGDKTLLAGNIGKSAVRELKNLTKDHLAVLELSSFQLAGMGLSCVSPHIAVVTNIYEDHLDWHPDMDDYIDAKKNIFNFQKKSDVAVVNRDNDIIGSFVEEILSRLITFSLDDKKADYYTDEEFNVYERGEKLLSIEDAILKGRHNIYNITAAVAAARIFEVDTGSILSVLREFSGVSGRQEFVREVGGVKFYNDTTATGLDAMLAALKRFGPEYFRKIVMISGGVDKRMNYAVIRRMMQNYVKAVVLLDGSASEKMAEVLAGTKVDVRKYYGDFEEAIHVAHSIASDGDMVILCPGASSLNMFVNEFDRGRQFNEIVTKLKS